jgi:hypothetical protein
MTVSTVAAPVPAPLYQRIERLAKATRRSVPETLASALAAALPPAPDLPQALADELAGLHWLSDAGLRKAIQPTFSRAQQERLGELNVAEDERQLTAAEEAERTQLLAEYQRSLLRRAEAFAILAQRGYPVPDYDELGR